MGLLDRLKNLFKKKEDKKENKKPESVEEIYKDLKINKIKSVKPTSKIETIDEKIKKPKTIKKKTIIKKKLKIDPEIKEIKTKKITQKRKTKEETKPIEHVDIGIDISKISNNANTQINNALKSMRKKPNIVDIQRQIGETKTSRVKFQISDNLNDYSNVYEDVLKDGMISVEKNGKQDNELIQVLIENRRRLQHRFAVKIEIATDQGAAGIEIIGLLAEDASEIYNYVTPGQTYTSEELKTVLNQFKDKMTEKYGCIGGEAYAPASGKCIVRDMEATVSFA